jgi:hypothetical protein
MSAGTVASVRVTDPQNFSSMLDKPLLLGVSETTVTINGSEVDGWKVSHTGWAMKDKLYNMYLRRPLDEELGTAEYVGVIVSMEGEIVKTYQYLLIQNDYDYANSGLERFDSIVLARRA